MSVCADGQIHQHITQAFPVALPIISHERNGEFLVTSRAGPRRYWGSEKRVRIGFRPAAGPEAAPAASGPHRERGTNNESVNPMKDIRDLDVNEMARVGGGWCGTPVPGQHFPPPRPGGDPWWQVSVASEIKSQVNPAGLGGLAAGK